MVSSRDARGNCWCSHRLSLKDNRREQKTQATCLNSLTLMCIVHLRANLLNNKLLSSLISVLYILAIWQLIQCGCWAVGKMNTLSNDYSYPVWGIKVGIIIYFQKNASIDLKEFKLHTFCFRDFRADKTISTRWSGARVQVWVQVWASVCHLAITPVGFSRRQSKVLA